jgi:hypothetical protein
MYPTTRSEDVDVRIGVTNAPRELNIELADNTDAVSLKSDVEKALASDSGVLWLTDKHDRQVAVPAAKIAYIEIGSENRGRIGFANS